MKQKKNKLDWNAIERLHSEGMNDNEIARELDASVQGIRYVRKDVLHLPHNIKTYTITPEMEDIIIGTVLGDAWIGYLHKGCTAPKWQVQHCFKQTTYTLDIYKRLGPILLLNIETVEPRYQKFKGKSYWCDGSIKIATPNLKELIPYREAFYPEGTKILPIEYLRDKLNARSIAYWYMDDGCRDTTSNSYILNTQCFSRENLKEFTKMLLEKFGLDFSIKKDNSLYLRHKCNDLFESMVREYLTEDMLYKIGSSLNSTKQGTS